DLHDPASFTLLLLEEPAGVEAGDANGVPPMPADARALAQGLERIMPGAVRIWRVADAESDGEDGLAQAYGRSRPSFYLLR
ncbi:FAD-binding monooxygenase, partial [Paraburkholderia sp. SIMBA_049]